MLKCYDCGTTFDFPQTAEDYRGEFWGMPAYETISFCPACGSEDYDEQEIVDRYYGESEDE